MIRAGRDAGAWISDEPTVPWLLGRVLSRARRRWGLVLAVAAGATALVVGYRATRPPAYKASIEYLLEEGELVDPGNEPRPPRDIRRHVSNVALSAKQLEAIMRKYHLSDRWLERNREEAIQAFREDIEIEVERNYFVYDRRPSDPPRSAAVVVSLRGSSERKTMAILQEIAAAIVRDQKARFEETLREARELLGGQIEQAKVRREQLQDSMADLAAEAANAPEWRVAEMEGRLAAMLAEASSATRPERSLQRGAATAAFTVAAVNAHLGTRLHPVDERVEATVPPVTPARLALGGAAVFVAMLVLTALTVGAFDDRVYGEDDLVDWGLPVFGALHRFPMDDARGPGAHASGAGTPA